MCAARGLPSGGAGGERSLALVVIARDEARCIERCLHSAAPHVDRMVVLDTGSKDATAELARQCGAQVHHMRWTHSFAEARNRALAVCDADWNLVLDADEWVESWDPQLRRRLAGPCFVGRLRIDSAFGEGRALGVASDWVTRLLPRSVRYVGDVHEQPVSNWPCERLPIVIGHDGYTPGLLKAKQGRNRSMLTSALAQGEGVDPYTLYQLGKDFEVYGEFSEAAHHYQKALDAAPSTAPYRHSLTVRCMHCLGQSGRLEEAFVLASDAMGEWAESPDYQFTLGNLCLDAAVAYPHDALAQWLPMAQAAWQRCLEIGERPELDGSVVGRGSFLAAHNLQVILEGQGDREGAQRYAALGQQLRQDPLQPAV